MTSDLLETLGNYIHTQTNHSEIPTSFLNIYENFFPLLSEPTSRIEISFLIGERCAFAIVEHPDLRKPYLHFTRCRVYSSLAQDYELPIACIEI